MKGLKQIIIILVGVLPMILLPAFLSSFYLGLVTEVLIFGLFAMSLNLLVGYCGLPSLGHSAFFGTAGYTVALLSMSFTQNGWLLILGGLIMAGITSALFGLLALRTRGEYFLMITLALSQVLWGLAFKLRSLTNAEDGITGLVRPNLYLPWSFAHDISFYFLTLICVAFAAVLLSVIIESPFGQAIRGVRENEVRLQVLGYNVWLCKYFVFVISGIFGGLAGVLFVFYNRFVSPADLSVILSAKVLLMVILGGAGTLLGPLVGSALLVFLENEISSLTERWLLILGSIYVIVVMFIPEGVCGAIRAKWRNIRKQ